MLTQSDLREKFKSLIQIISSSECSLIDPVIHSCIVTVGEELRVLRLGPGQEDFYIEMYTKGSTTNSLWGLTDIVLGYKKDAKQVKHMTRSEQESVISTLQSFKNVSLFAATKLAILRRGMDNDRIIADDSLLPIRSDQSVKMNVPPIFGQKPDVLLAVPVKARITCLSEKNTPSITGTSKPFPKTICSSKWLSNGDKNLSDSFCSLNKQQDLSLKELGECTSSFDSCDSSVENDTRIIEKQAKNGYYPSKSDNSVLYLDSTTDLEILKIRKEEIESDDTANSGTYQAEDALQLIIPKSESIADEKYFSPRSYKHILMMKSEKNEQCQAMPLHEFAKRKKENAAGMGEVDGPQISFKDSVEVLVSGEEEHNESTTLDLKITGSRSHRASGTEKSNITWARLTSTDVGETPSTHNSRRLTSSSNISGKRKKTSLQCEETGCSYKARSRGELQQHMRKHTGERPIPCEWKSCGKKFKDKSTYRVHYKSVHLKRKDYKCLVPGCGKTFGCAKSRNRHSTNINLHQSKTFYKSNTRL